MEEAYDEPIDYFQFRQMPAEFKLKSCPKGMESPAWAAEITPRSSLLAISHRKGLIMYPHYERGALAFAPIANLAEKDYLPSEAIGFPGDESFITALCLSADDTHLLVAKRSGKLYSIDLAVEQPNKKPFISKIAKLESSAIQLLSADEAVLVVSENGKLSQFCVADLKELECKYTLEGVSCVANLAKTFAFGFKDSNKIVLYESETLLRSAEVPVESGLGINSLHFATENIILCSVKPASATEDINLLVLDTKNDKFRSFMDPCASRPPGPNQFYFASLNNWSAHDLLQFVAVANRNSPDIGVAGRLHQESEFVTFFIDNDEGLAQLPLINSGKTLTFPVGLAIDFTSTFKHENRQDPDAEPFHPAPILWILTTSGQLCPFAMLKSNESGPWSFMKSAPTLTLSPPRPLVIQAPQSDADDTSPSVSAQQPELLSVSASSSSLSVSTFSSEEEDEVSESVPATPSKMSLSAITSLQKSAEKLPEPPKPIEPIPFKLFSSIDKVEKTKKVEMIDSAKTNEMPQSSQQSQPAQPFKFEFPKPEIKADSNGAFKFEISKPEIKFESKPSPVTSTSTVPSTTSPMSIVSQEPTIPPPIKKEENMESITCNPYQSILLTEVVEAHASMQNDLHELKLLAYKNSILLRQNTSKYFQSLEALETYANKVEALLGSGERVFGALKEKTESLRMNFDEIWAQSRRLNSYLQGLKNDARIDWQAKAARLDELCSDVCLKIAQLRELLASKTSKVTISFLHQNIQERLQSIVVHLSNLFVFNGETEAITLDRIRTLCLSSDSLVDEMSALLIAEPKDDVLSARKQRQNRLLEVAKARGARMLIPQVRIETSKVATVALKSSVSSIDDQLVNAFITSVKLSDPVPEFRDNNAPISAQPSINPFSVKKEDPKKEEPKKEEIKPFSFAPLAKKEEPKKEEVKPFSFTSVEKKEEPKPTIIKEEKKPFAFTFSPEPAKKEESVDKKEESKPVEQKTFSFAAVEKKDEVKPFSFAPVEKKEETKPVEQKPFSFAPVEKKDEVKPVEQKPFSFAPTSSSPVTKPNDNPFAFKFDFNEPAKPEETKAEPVKANVETEKKPIPAIFGLNPESKPSFTFASPATSNNSSVSPAPSTSSTTSTAPAIPALLTAQNAFAPSALTGNQTTPSFSVTSTPTFGTPTFGQTSVPAFGQTSLPTMAIPPASSTLNPNAAAPKPGAFAAFAQNSQGLGFSSFAAPQAQSGTGLSFANFSANAANKDAEKKDKPGFNFSGFRG